MMEDALVVSNVVLWLTVIVLAGVVLALVRQIGVLHERIQPVGALMLGHGPRPGEAAPLLEVLGLSGAPISVGGVDDEGKSTLLLFVSPTCPVCKTLLPMLPSLQRNEGSWLRIVLASDGPLEEQRRFVANHRLERQPYVVSTELGLAFGVGRLPHAVLIDEHGVLRSSGLVNSREHLESLFESKERDLVSLQEYATRVASGGDRT